MVYSVIGYQISHSPLSSIPKATGKNYNLLIISKLKVNNDRKPILLSNPPHSKFLKSQYLIDGFLNTFTI
jgi:hypothetical protein